MDSNKMIKVTEDGGGTITMYAIDSEGNEYVHAGYEYAPDMLLRDIYAVLLDDDDVTDWENNDLTNPTLIRTVREYGRDTEAEDIDYTTPLTIDEYDDYYASKYPITNASTIAYAEDGKLVIRYDRLGLNGRQCFFGAACEGEEA